jgi:hypothetical protein
MLLQRSDIPLSSTSGSWRRFRDEAKELYGAFQNISDATEGGQLMFSVVAGEDSWLHITLVPQQSQRSDHRLFDSKFAKRVLTTFTAVERELTLLTTPVALLEHWPFSQFLEYRAIRQLSKEKAELWKNLLGKKGLTQKRIGTIHQRDKLKWIISFDDEDLAYARTKGRKREWWDIVDGTDTQGLLRDVRAFQDTGRKLAVSCTFTDEAITPTVSSISLHSYRSTRDITELIAYTELISNLLNLAYTSTQPLSGFQHLLEKLKISKESTTYWTTKLQALDSTSDPTKKPPPPSRIDPFHSLKERIIVKLRTERAYIPIFIKRYNEAGGFYPTTGRKLHALMVVDEYKHPITRIEQKGQGKNQKKGKSSLNKNLLNGLDEVRIGDAWDKGEDLDGRVRKSPGVDEERVMETAKWVDNMQKLNET